MSLVVESQDFDSPKARQNRDILQLVTLINPYRQTMLDPLCIDCLFLLEGKQCLCSDYVNVFSGLDF